LSSTRARRSLRHSVAAVIAAVMVLLGVTTGAVPAFAKPSVSDVEKQIDAANNKLEGVVEDYDRIHSLLTANQAKVAKLTASLKPLQLQVDVAQAELAPLIRQIYVNGPTTTGQLLVGATSVSQMLQVMSTVDEVSKRNREKIAGVITLRDQYQSQKNQLDAAIVTEKSQYADLAAKKSSIQSQLASLQKLRLKVYGENGPPLGTLRPVACPFTYIGGAAGLAARTACQQIGKPYVWAATGPNSFDCSGLMLYAWGKAGKTLRHYTKWQWDDASPVSRADLRPGDLVFFYPPTMHHVGMYVGGGWIVHAPHTGDVVRMAKMDTMPIAGFRRP